MLAQLWRRMRTQTEAFWREFAVSDEDIEGLYSSFLEKEEPRTLDELALQLVRRYCEADKARLLAELERGPVYRPSDKHEVGQEILFPTRDYVLGKVESARPGRNPKYGPFEVIGVRFPGKAEAIEFASSFTQPHPLNLSVADDGSGGQGEQTPERLFELYGDHIRAKLDQALRDDPEVCAVDGRWFLKSLLPEVHIGHLNLAEAMITMSQRPLTVDELMVELDLAPDAKPSARRFALELALDQDERFDAIPSDDAQRWFLFALEPTAVVDVPWRLLPERGMGRAPRHLLSELVGFAREINDELDDLPGQAPAGDSVSFVLSYAHWREGTLPLCKAVRAFLPDNAGDRFPINMTLGPDGKRVAGWALLKERYAWGLGDWYRAQEIPVGATVNIARGADPRTLAVSYERRPRRGEWVKEANVVDGALVFEMQRRAYTCEYDRNLVLTVVDQEALDKLALQLREREATLFDTLLKIVPELTKFSSKATFHATTLYAAVNVLRRVGAAPVFAELTTRACFDPVGAGNWTFNADLKDVVYGTEEEMRERPFSQQAELVRDTPVAI
ncbi:MAG: hypothetical protein GXY76_12915 [Chloroflexi bacterium]|nr:hypothetical protein [Chloroflexota bacterium]